MTQNVNVSAFLVDLESLRVISDIQAVGSFPPGNTYPSDSVDGYLYHKISLLDVQNKFKFSSDSILNSGGVGQDDIATVYARTNSLFDNTIYTLSSHVYSTDNLMPSDVMSNLYDYKASANGAYGRTAQTFIQHLAQSVFGSRDAVDMFSNESDIDTSYETSINDCISKVNEFFTKSDTRGVLAAARSVYNTMMSTHTKRFGLKYRAVANNAMNPDTYNCGTVDDGNGSGAAVSVVLVSSGVLNIIVTTAGNGYRIGDEVRFNSKVGSDTIATIPSINSVQAAMLNGQLSSETAMPFEADDTLTITFRVNSNLSQTNVSSEPVQASVLIRTVIRVVDSL
jgi:hypothetical protein